MWISINDDRETEKCEMERKKRRGTNEELDRRRRKKETAIATFQWDTNYTELEGS